MLTIIQRSIFVFMISLAPLLSYAQLLANPSFEGEQLDATMPMGWFSCKEGTTPDICPGPWGVALRPSDGSSYVGLITRPNGTWEAISQRFNIPLEANTCYLVTVDLARSPNYAGYSEAVQVHFWLGKNKCDRDVKISSVGPVEHSQWKTYEFKVTPEEPMEYIIIEAGFPKGNTETAGNILIDALRQVEKCPGA